MESMPHHREGTQNELDNAYDEAHRDNNELKSQQLTEELHNTLPDTEAHGKLSEHEKATADREKNMSPELAETITRLKKAGYLDASLEGKEFHHLNVESFSKKEAVNQFFQKNKNSRGGEWAEHLLSIYDGYSVPENHEIDVIVINLGYIDPDDALEKIHSLGLRPLSYEESIQFGINHGSSVWEPLVALDGVLMNDKDDFEVSVFPCITHDISGAFI